MSSSGLQLRSIFPRSWAIFLPFLLLLVQITDLRAQVSLITTPPKVDSFPVVRTTISVSDNGTPAQFNKSHIQILEDGQNISDFELNDCDESKDAAIAVLFDQSGSMQFTVNYNGVDEFYDCFSAFLRSVPAPSDLALIPFNDTTWRNMPGSYHTYPFFKAGDMVDTTEFMDSVGGIPFVGNTDVDFALGYAVEVLKQSNKRKRAIVLVTDDGVSDDRYIQKLLIDNDIQIYILELDTDTIQNNLETAIVTGGKLYVPKDSSEYSPMMAQMAKDIFAKRCELRYVSKHPCPWWSNKILWVGLNYKAAKLSDLYTFSLRHNRVDSVAPAFEVTIPAEISRRVEASEVFPCERGIKSFTDSALVNFAKLKRVGDLPGSMYDSLVVADERYPASGYYVAIDSNGNRSITYIEYTPPPDTLRPIVNTATLTGNQYVSLITESRRWDRGLQSIILGASTVNLKLDSVVYESERRALAYASIIDPMLSAVSCIIARDSVGNVDSVCIARAGIEGDVLPPVIVQDMLEQPALRLTGVVRDNRALDDGLFSVSVTPIKNTSTPRVTYLNKASATVGVALVDSMFPATAYVLAIDSMGHSKADTLRYEPKPDVTDPVLNVVQAAGDLTVTASDNAAWDRGIKELRVVTSTNLNVSLTTYTSRWLASLTAAVDDPYSVATAVIEAEDSVGHIVNQTITFDADVKPPLLPLEFIDPVVFDVTPAPALLRRSVQIRNPNGEPVQLGVGVLTGDDSVFRIAENFPVVFGPGESKDIAFEFLPTLIGNWNAVYRFTRGSVPDIAIRLAGISTGSISANAGTSSVTRAGDEGVVTLTFGGRPDPLNIDKLEFEAVVNDDVAQLIDAKVVGCSGNENLCNYDLTFTDIGNGSYQIVLTRKSAGRSMEFAKSPAIELSYRTTLASESQTVISIRNVVGGSLIQTDRENGLISVGNDCGDSTLRDHLQLSHELSIMRLETTWDAIVLDLEVHVPAKIDVRLVDMLGLTVSSNSAASDPSVAVALDTRHLTQGNYFLQILMDGRLAQSRPIQIVR